MLYSIMRNFKGRLSHAQKAWVVCLSAGLFFFYEFFQLNIFDVINQSLRTDFDLDAAQLSWMSSTYLWADILFLLPAGTILDRFSTRKTIFCAMSVCILGTFGFALTHSFLFACIFHFLSGIGNAFCFLSCIILISHWFPPRRQAFVVGTVVTMAFIGGMVAHTPFACLNNYYGWRVSLLIDGFFGVIILAWITMTVEDLPAYEINKKPQKSQHKHSFIKILRNSQNWLGGLYTSFLNLPILVLCALWGASYLQITHHVSKIEASNIVSLIFIGSIIGCPLAGLLSDKQGRRKPLMIFGAIATLITLAPLFLYSSLSKNELSLIFLFLGLFTSTQVLSYPLIAESNPLENTGIATGVASVLIMGGGGVSQVIFGLLMRHHVINTSVYTSTDFQYAMWMFPFTAIAALFTALLIRETACKRSD